jgi:hypothetical protein
MMELLLIKLDIYFVFKMKRQEMEEIEKELSQLLEITITLEDELNNLKE